MNPKTTSFLLEHSPFPLLLVDKELTILESSKSICSFFEHPEEYTFDRLTDLIGAIPKAVMSALQKGEFHSEIILIISKTGQFRWIKTSFHPCEEDVSLYHVVFDDVTETQVQLDLELQASKIAKIGSWKVDLIKQQVTWSRMTKEIHEVSQDYVPDLEQGINFYKEGVHREMIIKAVTNCIEKGDPFDEELIIVTAKGNDKWVRAIGEAEVSNGKIIGFQGVFQDIDEIKKERIQGQILDDRMRVAVESANIGIWDWNIVKDELIWDDNMFSIFGIDRGDFEGAYDAWESAVHPQDKEQAAYEVGLALEGKKDFDTEFRITKGDGSNAYIQGRAQVFRDSQGKPLRMVGTNTEITKIKRKDERLRRLLQLTEKQNQKLVNFAHIVSHNLRSNSSNISMISGMLLAGAGTDKTKTFLEMIQQSSEKLEETLNQLNEIVRIQSTDKNDLIQLEVAPLLKNVQEGINALLEQSKAKVTVKVDPSVTVYGIKAYLSSVFQNLLTNCIKYRDPKRALKIEIAAQELENQTIITFKDNGVGIDLERHRKSLFGMYKTFHGNSDAKGIGLFISKNQMEAMNGSIEVQSTEGKGTTFSLYFKK